jgi:hypothetical protein
MSRVRTPVLVGLALIAALSAPLPAQDLLVYDNQLRSGFQDWSWATHDLAYTAQNHSAPNAIQMEPDDWEGLYFHSDQSHDAADYLSLRFWVKGQASGGQQMLVLIQLNGTARATLDLDDFVVGGISASQWREAVISFAAIGLTTGGFNELTLQAHSAPPTPPDQPPVLFDDIRFVADPTPPGAVTVQVSPNLDRWPISAFVYGVNFASAAQLADVGYPLNRWGGNRTTRYNWQLDLDNSAFDWFYQNYTGPGDPEDLPVGSGSDRFVTETRAAGAEAILTVPTIGRASGPDRARRWAFSVSEYGPQLQTECTYFPPPYPDWCQPDAGNGLCDTGPNCSAGRIVGNDPDDVSFVPSGGFVPFVADWMEFVESRVGSAGGGGVRFVALDNEPMLWNSTHADIHPAPPGYDEVWAKGRDVAAALKARDPQVQILGPDTWGYCDLWTSAIDAPGDCTDGPDRQAHGGTPFVQWYLERVCAHQQQSGVRLVDYVDVHYYPQSGEAFGDESYAAIRLQSIRELYDPNYVSQSWIAATVRLLPRLREWVAAACPGVRLAVTEYAWGADTAPSGALAQAEVLAIFGRERVGLATRWVVPASGTKTEEAFRLFLDYDGAGARIHGDNVRATTSDLPAVGAYAVRGSSDQLYVLLFNKDDEARTTNVTVTAPVAGPAQLWRFTAATPLGAVGSLPVAANAFSANLPARSATVAVLRVVSNLIFRDGVDSGSTWAWSSVSR